MLVVQHTAISPSSHVVSSTSRFAYCSFVYTSAIVILIHWISKVSNWLTAKRLSLNVQKTHFLIFKAKNKRANNTTSIRIKDKNIERVTNTNFLGVNIDQDHTWKCHKKKVATKISKLTGIMAKARHHLPLKTLQTLYSDMVYLYLNYCSIVWASIILQDFRAYYTSSKRN